MMIELARPYEGRDRRKFIRFRSLDQQQDLPVPSVQHGPSEQDNPLLCRLLTCVKDLPPSVLANPAYLRGLKKQISDLAIHKGRESPDVLHLVECLSDAEQALAEAK